MRGPSLPGMRYGVAMPKASGRALVTPWLVLLLLSGCTSTAIELHGDIPERAAIEPLPLTVGLYVPADLADHVHQESIPNYGKWTIKDGAAHVEMWRRLMSSMFEHVVTASGTSDPASGADLIISPTLDELQFSIPAQTKNSFYEVWIRYQVGVYTPAGELIAQFPHVAYGKSRSHTFSRDGDGVQEAAYWALRDAGAFFARDFPQNPEVRDWLDTRLHPLAEHQP